jgi:hypothetical protein
MLLTYREGQAADSVIDAGVDACKVLYEVGVNLARLHQVPPAPHLRSFEQSGACNLGDHVADRWTPLFRASEHTAAHPFVPFYEARVKALQVRGRPSGCARRLSIATSVFVNGEQGRAALSVYSRAILAALFRLEPSQSGLPIRCSHTNSGLAVQELVRMASLPTGIIHGDPFLDNILVDAESGAFKAFVDFEDSCVGPLLFDVACTAAAGCYRPAADGGPDVLAMQLLRDLLRGYASARRFEEHEVAAFVPFMRMALLCNCTWRFKNFNLDHREVESCRDAYRELQWRIEDLEQAERVGEIDELVRAVMAAV